MEPPEPTSNINSPAEENQTAADGAGMGMDVDDDAPAPEYARMTLTLTNGQSVGVQSDQVTELGPETINLSVPDKNVMHTAWNPRDPAILATGGQALCRIWTISRSTLHDISPSPSNPNNPNSSNPNEPNNPNPTNSNGPDNPNNLHSLSSHDNDPNNLQYVDTLDPSDEASLVTTMAWRPDGEALAVATRGDVSGGVGAVSLWTKNGKCIDELPAAQDTVLMLRWNPSGTYLLGITNAGTASSATVIWDTQSSKAIPPVHIDHIVLDAVWTDHRTFTMCGHGVIGSVIVDSECIVSLRTDVEPGIEKNWTCIQYDSITNTIALVAEEEGVVGIIDSSGHLHATIGHDAGITAMAFQPVLDPSSYSLSNPRLLMTSSLDGTIKSWNTTKPFTISNEFSFGKSTPAMVMSFTPDGNLVAAANWNRVLIWNVGTGGIPIASWKGEQGKWQGLMNGADQDSGIGEEEDGPVHSLSWDADGRKLAYGLGSQVSTSVFSLAYIFTKTNPWQSRLRLSTFDHMVYCLKEGQWKT